MYVVIGTKEYTEISKLKFEPETDVTGGTIPINELWVSVKTDDTVDLGERISLYDDADTLWAKYWVTYAEREDRYNVRVHGQSALTRIESVTMDPEMYSSASAATVLADILEPLGSGEYSIDSSFSTATVSGYAPKQSARVRLQWVCFCIGAYLKNFFNDKLQILPISDTSEKVIPLDRTYWKPKITYKDHVTAVKATYYEFTAGTPSRVDDYVEVDGTYYIQTSTEVTLTNDEAPEGARENVLEIGDVTLINEDNVDDVLSFVAKYLFKRTEAELSAVNNADYMPGERLYFFGDADQMYEGYVHSCSFSFGLQAKATMRMLPTEARESATLKITYMWGTKQVGEREFTFPVGYSYEVENPYIDITLGIHRYVFRPASDTVTGTMVSGGVAQTVSMYVALDLHEGVLEVISVDDVNMGSESVVIS